MNENENHHFHMQDEQAPSSLMPALLARLGLDGSEQVPEPSLAALKIALSSPEWTVRIDAVQKLEHVRDEESFQLLLAALHDEDDSVRACAIRVLGRRSDSAKHVALEQLETALHDSAWHVRETAVYALAVLGDQTSLLALREALHDSDDAVRQAAQIAIQRLQHEADKRESSKEQPVLEQALPLSPSFIGVCSQQMRRFVLRLQSHASTDTEEGLDMLEETQEVETEYPPVASERTFGTKRPTPPRQVRPQRRLMRVLEQGMAAVLILALLVGWFALSRWSHTSSGSPSDADTSSPGKPVATVQSNFYGLSGWSPDGHTFIYQHVNTQKHTLEVVMLDAATGRSTFYPVLDASWTPDDYLMVLGGRYLLALRPHGANQATMVIWDIIGHRAITTQIVSARLAGNGQVVSPQIMPSDNGQKFAAYFPDGTVAIWDLASGQKLVTCEGNVPLRYQGPVYIRWYNHDQDLLLNSIDGSQIVAWNATTGARLFNLHENDAPETRHTFPQVSPNSKYLLLTTGHPLTDPKMPHASSYYISDTVEILDASSGQVIHRYPLSASSEEFVWLPDSQRLLVTTVHTSSSDTPSSLTHATEQVSIWNIFTNQITPLTSASYDGVDWHTADGRYMILGSRDGRSLKIWQTSNSRLIATIETPGTPARTDAFFSLGNQYLVIGQRENFSIWSIASGKLLYTYHGPTPFSLYGQSGSLVTWSPNEKYLSMIAGSEPSIGSGSLAIWRIP
ncbi:MAG TPA: HEAT repeat domain-containing protein [Ktedonobacteraceae bacterium]|jgi:WD40 repeat protein|nr:HEAT repeat domain-containing protein [Ktedonobacteraceae bacterium]